MSNDLPPDHMREEKKIRSKDIVAKGKKISVHYNGQIIYVWYQEPQLFLIYVVQCYHVTTA